MAGFVAKGNNEYIATVKLAAGADAMHNGQFVNVNWTNSTASTPVNTDVVYFVENVIDTVDEEQINDVNFTITAGNYLRIKKLLPGEMFITNKATGTPVVGDIVDVGTTGKITATSGSPVQKYQVIEKPTMWNETVYKCIVLD
ncbi:MAG: hypothetical protein ACM3O3_12835 [Syntrophothermus sp.]